jgi:imidazolonepropionase-like amidohydrolase
MMAGLVTMLAVLGIYTDPALGFYTDLDAQPVIVLKNVNVVDGTGSEGQRNKTVIIAGDHIQSIVAGQTRTPSKAKAIDMDGQTIMPVLGVAEQYGTLQAGQKANFIVLGKDPSQDIRNPQSIRAVWKNGVKVSDSPLRTGDR